MKFLGIFTVAILGCAILNVNANAVTEDEVNNIMNCAVPIIPTSVWLLGDDRTTTRLAVLISSLSLSCVKHNHHRLQLFAVMSNVNGHSS